MSERLPIKARKDKYPFLKLHQPWAKNENPIWLASTVSFHRNLRAFPFPSKLGSDERQQVLSLLSGELLKSPALSNPSLIRAEETGPIEKEFLFEHFLTRRGFQQAMSGEGFVVDETGSLFALVNIRDHLQLQITDTREELEQAWNQLVQLESHLGRTLNFSFTSRFGFLTAEPKHCGTGLVTRALLHLPALIHTRSLEETFEKLGEDEVIIASILGGVDETVGDLITVSNRCSIGLNDEQVLQTARTYVTKLIVEEKRCRSSLRDSASADMKDHVARAFGLLRHSYQVETPEAWGAISLLKLGLDLGFVTGTTHAALNELLFLTRRAHLVCEYTEELTQDELPHRRAEYIHAHLADTDLTI